MNEQLLNEIGERLKNGEDLLSIKADLIYINQEQLLNMEFHIFFKL